MRRREFIRLFASTAVSWPLAARAQQQGKVPTVGILWHAGSVAEEAIFLTQIQRGLKDLGYVEGGNVTLVNTFAGEQYERFNSNAAELVGRKVDVIVAVTLAAALAAQRATNTIPIVFIVVPDPVATKLVASLAHPGRRPAAQIALVPFSRVAFSPSAVLTFIVPSSTAYDPLTTRPLNTVVISLQITGVVTAYPRHGV